MTSRSLGTNHKDSNFITDSLEKQVEELTDKVSVLLDRINSLHERITRHVLEEGRHNI
ncbi:MAG: hypothetical protein IH840_00160 [Candidatus Heimdallarchaeota archaeon]|nr:hypothetical protein [Candidatus Heimdallarchaeota archaeon]